MIGRLRNLGSLIDRIMSNFCLNLFKIFLFKSGRLYLRLVSLHDSIRLDRERKKVSERCAREGAREEKCELPAGLLGLSGRHTCSWPAAAGQLRTAVVCNLLRHLILPSCPVEII